MFKTIAEGVLKSSHSHQPAMVDIRDKAEAVVNATAAWSPDIIVESIVRHEQLLFYNQQIPL
jgi:hypothetical protein